MAGATLSLPARFRRPARPRVARRPCGGSACLVTAPTALTVPPGEGHPRSRTRQRRPAPRGSPALRPDTPRFAVRPLSSRLHATLAPPLRALLASGSGRLAGDPETHPLDRERPLFHAPVRLRHPSASRRLAACATVARDAKLRSTTRLPHPGRLHDRSASAASASASLRFPAQRHLPASESSHAIRVAPSTMFSPAVDNVD